MQHVTIRSEVLIDAARPASCARHGNPAVDATEVHLQSQPAPDTTPSFGGSFMIAVRTMDHLQQIKHVPVAGWPLCSRCVRRRRLLRRTAAALFFGGLALVIAAVLIGLLSGQQPLLIIPLLLGVAAAITSGFVFGRTSWSRIAGAIVSHDGQWVRFPNPHPRFAAEIHRIDSA